MKQSTLTRRLAAGAVALMIGAAGAVALAAPANAAQPGGGDDNAARYGKEVGLAGIAECDLETETWTVAWTVTNPSSFVQATILSLTPDEVDGLEVDQVIPKNESAVGTQTFPSGTESAELTVELKWSWKFWHKWTTVTDDATEVVELGECSPEEPPEEPEEPEEPPAEEPEPTGFVDAEFTCEIFTLTIANDFEEEVTLTVVPSVGDSVDVTVPAGETSEPVEFPSSEGLVVDLQAEGESVLVDGPFEITSEDWEELECEAEGEGGELPVTGMSTGLMALGAVLLLAIGGGLFLVARRRRVSFSA